MRWRSGRRSRNIEDVRSHRPAASGGRLRGGRGLKLGGGATMVVLVIAMLAGGDTRRLLLQLLQGSGQGSGAGVSTSGSSSSTASGGGAGSPTSRSGGASDEQADFVSVVLADTEDTWDVLFRQQGQRYHPPKLVLFRDAVRSACGMGEAAVGPFYCPADQKAYLDLSFFADLHARFRAPGDFAQAYVIAHEIGHHVQNLLGTSTRVRQAQRGLRKGERNALSVRLELQADCYAGLWAHHANRARQVLEQGDVDEALGAAAAIGDDRLQQQSRGHVTPESFTHGTSEQRIRWFKRGLESGRLADCDTFATPR